VSSLGLPLRAYPVQRKQHARSDDIPIVVDQLVDGETEPEQVATTQCRSLRDVWVCRWVRFGSLGRARFASARSDSDISCNKT
jgi:hypothetical protein